jgi:hypothetical protein
MQNKMLLSFHRRLAASWNSLVVPRYPWGSPPEGAASGLHCPHLHTAAAATAMFQLRVESETYEHIVCNIQFEQRQRCISDPLAERPGE